MNSTMEVIAKEWRRTVKWSDYGRIGVIDLKS